MRRREAAHCDRGAFEDEQWQVEQHENEGSEGAEQAGSPQLASQSSRAIEEPANRVAAERHLVEMPAVVRQDGLAVRGPRS